MSDNITVVTNELDTLDIPQEEETQTETQGEEQEASQADDAPSSIEESQAEKEQDASQETKEADNQGQTRYQKRIDKLVRQREEAEREKQRLADELNFYKSKERAAPKEEQKEISPLDFDTYEDYEEALNSQTKRSEKKAEIPATKNIDVAYDSAVRMLDDLFEDAREKYSDFDKVVRNPDIPVTRDMVLALSEIDNAGEVAYHLANNEKLVKDIAKLSPYRQAIELGKISDKLLNPPKAEKKVTKAPEPISPVGSGGDVTQKDPSKMSFKEYEAYMKTQTKKNGFW